jgi:hypothetical protein
MDDLYRRLVAEGGGAEIDERFPVLPVPGLPPGYEVRRHPEGSYLLMWPRGEGHAVFRMNWQRLQRILMLL